MKLRLVLLIILFLAIYLELVIISFPLMFLITYLIFSIENRFRYLIPAAVLSIVGDSIFLNPIGATLLSVLVVLIFINLYSIYLGSRDTLVYILFGAIGTFSYAIIFGYSFGGLVRTVLLLTIFWIIYRLLPVKHFSL